MINLKNSSSQMELKNSVKRLVTELYQSVTDCDDRLIDNDESIASYVARMNDPSLNRSFLDYCRAVKNYADDKIA